MNTKSKPTKATKPQVKLQDIKPKQEPKGGATTINASKSNTSYRTGG